jgi:hypothetical protein
MAAPIGNQFWRLRSKHGRDRIFQTPDDLWNAAVEYFEAVEDSFEEVEVPHVKGVLKVKHKQPFLKGDFALFVGFSRWEDVKTYETREGFGEIFTRIEQIIYSQKFRGASVGIFNANIIARDLGLKDSSEVDLTTGGKPFTLNVKPDTE